LGIDLASGRDLELFKWLVACILFGHRIQQDIAAKAFRELDRGGFTSPNKVREAGWQSIVDALGRGHFVRYDESTADRLLAAEALLREKYKGSMRELLDAADDRKDLEKRLKEFKGIGPKSVSIFLRDLESLRK
jgi:hypothetical protein